MKNPTTLQVKFKNKVQYRFVNNNGNTRRRGVKGSLILDSPANALIQMFSAIQQLSCLTTSGLKNKIRKEKGDDDLDCAGTGHDVMCHNPHTCDC